MELEIKEVLESLSAGVQAGLERLAAAANVLEGWAARLEAREATHNGEVGKITAAVEIGTQRERELERRLAEAEEALATLQASGGRQCVREEPRASLAARKTLPAATVQLLGKQGIDAGEQVDVQQLDAALAGLSVEQRFAVKAQMLRTGALTL